MADSRTAKYLYNPENERVMINTPLKRRVRPNLIPCNRLDASDVQGDPRVLFARRNDESPVIEETPPEESNKTVADGFADIITQVHDSEDKAELRQIGADIGLGLVKSMKLNTMKNNILKQISEIQEGAR